MAPRVARSPRARARRANEVRLRPIHPNAGIEGAYRNRILGLVEEFERSILWWVRASYRANEPEITGLAGDESPAAALRRAIEKLRRRWLQRFDDAAEELARYFAKSVAERNDGALRKILKDGGFAVEFRLTRAQNDVLQSIVHENVSLIKSIPQDLLNKVEGHVMRSVQTGRDMASLAKTLEHDFGVSKKRARFIARDQNEKATGALTRARYLEIGVEEAEWLHSHAGRKPRPTHVAMNGKRYAVAKGMYDSAVKRFIYPGQEPNCRCTSRPIIKSMGRT